MSEGFDRGWIPYLAPYLGFLLLVEISRYTPEGFSLFLLVLKPLLPAGLIVAFWWRGAYSELRGFRWSGAGPWLDAAVGFASALLWMGPYLIWPALRPEASAAFDPQLLGAGREGLALGLRFAGFALVTPLFEELFIRSFAMRVSEVFPGPGDFRDVPLGRFRWRSFIATALIFTAAHVVWEWWVALPWVLLTNLWFYRRQHVMALVVVHAVANATIFAAAVSAAATDSPLSLWFFL